MDPGHQLVYLPILKKTSLMIFLLSIGGMYMLDEEGQLVTREVNAKFVNGKPAALEATYTWKTTEDFERFMRFAQRYAEGRGRR